MSETQRLVQISTDCVFSGVDGSYSVADIQNPIDLYGETKAAAEIVSLDRRVLVIRTSIIGPETSTSYGLMSWFMNSEKAVNGYTNHMWNGVTTLELTKYIFGEHDTHDLKQLSCDSSVSKFELLRTINDVYGLSKLVAPARAMTDIDRTLKRSTIYTPKSIQDQLIELRSWYHS